MPADPAPTKGKVEVATGEGEWHLGNRLNSLNFLYKKTKDRRNLEYQECLVLPALVLPGYLRQGIGGTTSPGLWYISCSHSSAGRVFLLPMYCTDELSV